MPNVNINFSSARNMESQTSDLNTKSLFGGFFDKAIFGIILAVFVGAPIIFTPFTVQGLGFTKQTFFYILTLLLAIVWVTRGVLIGELKIKRTFLDWPFLALLAAYVLSAIFSIDRISSFIGGYGTPSTSLVSIFSYSLFFVIFLSSINSFKKIKLIYIGLLSAGAVVVFVALLQMFQVFVFPWDFTKNTSFNFIGSLTHLAVFISFLIPLAIVLFTSFHEWWKKILTLVPLVLGVLVLILLNITAAWIGLLIGAAIILIFSLSKIISLGENNRGVWLPLVFFAISIFFLLAGNIRIGNLNLPPEVTLNNTASWEITKGTLKQNFLLGSGPSTFSYNFSKYRPDTFNQNVLWNLRFQNPSNSFWEIVNTLGVVGTVAVIVFFLIFISSVFLILSTKKELEDKIPLLGVFSSTLGLIAASLFVNVNGPLVIIFMIGAALTMAAAGLTRPQIFSEINLSLKASPKYALGLAFLFLAVTAGVVMLIVLLVKTYVADVYVKQATKAANIEEAAGKINQAIGLVNYRDVYYLSLAQSFLDIANLELQKEKPDVNKIQQAIGASIQSGQKATELSPKNVTTWESLASIYQGASIVAGDALEFSRDAYSRAIDLDPKNPALRIGLASVYRQQAAQKEKAEEREPFLRKAEEEYKKSIDLKQGLSTPRYGLSLTYELWNRMNEAIDEGQIAISLTPSNLDYRFNVGRLYYNRGVNSQPGETNKKDESTALKNDDLDKAENIFKEIIKEEDKYINAHFNLGLLYGKENKKSEAKRELQKAIDLAGDQKTKDKIKEELDNLEK